MNRRAFLATLASAAAGIALDPERALWVPGRKRIFLPAQPPSLWSPVALHAGDIFTIAGVYAVNPITQRNLDGLQNFVITTNSRSGRIDPSLLMPRMVSDGVYRNYHGVLTPNARITPVSW